MKFDPIADLLTRIRNAQMARKKVVAVPYSKMKHAIVKVLITRKMIASAEVVVNPKGFQDLHITLVPNRTLTLRRVSKPGQRVYIQSRDIRPVLSGMGVAVISTSQGVIAGSEAYKKGLGGEYVCLVY